jgi:hypothetical protein
LRSTGAVVTGVTSAILHGEQTFGKDPSKG